MNLLKWWKLSKTIYNICTINDHWHSFIEVLYCSGHTQSLSLSLSLAVNRTASQLYIYMAGVHAWLKSQRNTGCSCDQYMLFLFLSPSSQLLKQHILTDKYQINNFDH